MASDNFAGQANLKSNYGSKNPFGNDEYTPTGIFATKVTKTDDAGKKKTFSNWQSTIDNSHNKLR